MAKFFVILFSLVYVTVISGIGALPVLFWGLSLTNYLSVAAILFASQMFVGGLYNTFIGLKDRVARNKLEAAKAMAESVQQLSINCAYCGTTNNVPILVSQQNKFDCHACKQTNSVLLSWSATRTTNPIMPKAQAAEIFKSIDEDNKKG